MLELKDACVSYGRVRTLHSLSFRAEAGEITCLLGRNGAGKSTALKAIAGLLPVASGEISALGKTVSNLPAHSPELQPVGYVPQGRRLFYELSVMENLEVGLLRCHDRERMLEHALGLFPALRSRLSQPSGTLSGGEQQMLAMARALCKEPRVLLLDEPTEGLQPSMVEQIQGVVVRLREEGIAVLLVEQRIDAIMSLADKAVFIESGRNLQTMDRAELAANPGAAARNLGV